MESRDLDAMRRTLETHQGPRLGDHAITGAVLAAFTPEAEPTLLFTRRAGRVSNFPGEISFPGGKHEGDETIRQTAIRETHEEIGIGADQLDIWGHLADHHAYGRHSIRCYVGRLRAGAVARANPAEVERIFGVPLAVLNAPEVYEGRRIPGDPGHRVVHYFSVSDEIVWGATGRLVADLLSLLMAWTPPSKPRLVTGRRGFLEGLPG